jgi:PIN domain nuclease of toxin-antitoxin system
LLDTCALIWLANAAPMSPAAIAELLEANREAGGVMVSPISAWEVGQLVAKGRLSLNINPLTWFETVLQNRIALAPMPPSVLVASSFLPGPLRDPSDRIIAATARAFRYRVMTRDRPLLDLAQAGHLEAIAC